MAKNYPRALVEFETVARYDPDYLELQLYLQRTRQRIEGKVEFTSEKSYALYYKGIDLYLEHEFAPILGDYEDQPMNLLFLPRMQVTG